MDTKLWALCSFGLTHLFSIQHYRSFLKLSLLIVSMALISPGFLPSPSFQSPLFIFIPLLISEILVVFRVPPSGLFYLESTVSPGRDDLLGKFIVPRHCPPCLHSSPWLCDGSFLTLRVMLISRPAYCKSSGGHLQVLWHTISPVPTHSLSPGFSFSEGPTRCFDQLWLLPFPELHSPSVKKL